MSDINKDGHGLRAGMFIKVSPGNHASVTLRSEAATIRLQGNNMGNLRWAMMTQSPPPQSDIMRLVYHREPCWDASLDST